MEWEDVIALMKKYQSQAGYRGKIIAKCIDCSVDPKGTGTWRMQVEACNCPTCPLYDVRPVMFPKRDKKENENETEDNNS